MEAWFQVIVIAPPEKMERAGETTYVTFERTFEMPFTPVKGLHVGFSPNLTQRDTRLPRYKDLYGKVADNTAIFEVKDVTYFPRPKSTESLGFSYEL